jgi:hypothetical protein
MRSSLLSLLSLVIAAWTISAAAQTAVQGSVAAMAATIPSDSQASGTVQIIAGSETETGTIQILTRGFSQTSEQISTASGSRAIVSSQGLASETANGTLQALPMELAVTSQSPDFPLPLLGAALNNPDEAFQFIGQETLNGRAANHVRFWDTFASNPGLQSLAAFTTTDVWIDPASRLPLRISYIRRNGGGSAPRVPVDVYYSNYQNLGGVLYPFSIQKSLNGTSWTTITISSATFNVGLTDSNFPVQ